MEYIPAQELKRRGISAVDKVLEKGPVYIVKNNRPRYVVLSAEDYEELLADLADARLAASTADLKEGRTQRGTAKDLLSAARKNEE